MLHASLTYTVKTEGAEVFRTETLDPPPLASLGEGQVLRLIHQGVAGSLIETEGGVKGWMRNGDMLAVKNAPGGDFRIGDQKVTGGWDPNISGVVHHGPDFDPEMILLDRTFNDEIVEQKDREEVELRHDEN